VGRRERWLRSRVAGPRVKRGPTFPPEGKLYCGLKRCFTFHKVIISCVACGWFTSRKVEGQNSRNVNLCPLVRIVLFLLEDRDAGLGKVLF
jgi:hypothetical protein